MITPRKVLDLEDAAILAEEATLPSLPSRRPTEKISDILNLNTISLLEDKVKTLPQPLTKQGVEAPRIEAIDDVRHLGKMGWNRAATSDRSRSQSSPPMNRVSVFQSQTQLHLRKSRHRATGSLSEKENFVSNNAMPIDRRGLVQARPRRKPLMNVTNTHQGGSSRSCDHPFASSTAVKIHARKSSRGIRAPMGLRIELDGKPLLDFDDSSLYHVEADDDQSLFHRAEDELLPHLSEPGPFVSNRYAGMGSSLESLPGDRPATATLIETVESSEFSSINTTPFREALAAFGSLFSPSAHPKNKSSDVTAMKSKSISPRLLPVSDLSISKSLKPSELAGMFSRLTGGLAASVAARYENVYKDNQYEEDAVAHDERFDWEEEMRSLEMQCGVPGQRV